MHNSDIYLNDAMRLLIFENRGWEKRNVANAISNAMQESGLTVA